MRKGWILAGIVAAVLGWAALDEFFTDGHGRDMLPVETSDQFYGYHGLSSPT